MAPTESRFSVLSEPIVTSLKTVGKRGFTTLIAGGFVDAFGPTLNVLALDGQFQSDQTRIPILRLVLNPFSQSCHIIGYACVGDVWAPLDDLAPFLSSLTFRSRPTLLIPSIVLPPEVTETLYSQFLVTFGSGPHALAKLLLMPEQTRTALLAFVEAWDGAIQFQYGLSTSRTLMPTNEFLDVLVRLCASCDLPFLQ